jgi:hypothetical protein
MFWGLIIGAALGYFFKPQIDKGVHKVVRLLRDRSGGSGSSY